MNYHRMTAALKYFIFARHHKGHGIHSPFVFDFINTVLREEIPPHVLKIVREVRKLMAAGNEIIEVNDLGAGPENMTSSCRSLSDIARRSSVNKRYGRILYNIALLYNGKDIIEMGTSVGISTLYMALGAPESEIISIEGCHKLAETAKNNFSRFNINNITVVTGSFDEHLPVMGSQNIRPSVVFVDGNHRKEPVLKYFALLKELITPGSVIIFDDINYSHEMNEAWDEIKRDSQVSVSIDIFQMGFVFFRGGMVKQDFVIRY